MKSNIQSDQSQIKMINPKIRLVLVLASVAFLLDATMNQVDAEISSAKDPSQLLYSAYGSSSNGAGQELDDNLMKGQRRRMSGFVPMRGKKQSASFEDPNWPSSENDLVIPPRELDQESSLSKLAQQEGLTATGNVASGWSRVAIPRQFLTQLAASSSNNNINNNNRNNNLQRQWQMADQSAPLALPLVNLSPTGSSGMGSGEYEALAQMEPKQRRFAFQPMRGKRLEAGLFPVTF